jgi:hypothetical protein
MNEGIVEALIYIVGFIIFVISSTVLLIVQRKLEKNMNENHFAVRKPLLTLIGAFLVTIVCAVLAFLLLTDTGNRVPGFVFLIITFVGLIIVANHIRWKIEVTGQKIYFRSLFGLSSKSFTFDCITKAVTKPEQYIGEKVILHAKDKEMLSINTWCRGWSLFEARLKQAGVEIVPIPTVAKKALKMGK